MPIDIFVALAGFAAITCFTPGPNNTMLMASGLNFGVRRTVPHVMGVALGFGFMVLAVGLGIGRLFEALPEVYTVLKIIAVGYLLWLAWRIAQSGSPDETDGRAGARPLSFVEGAAFQWVNPKGWIMAIGATTSFGMAGNVWASSLVIAAIFAVFGIASSAVWVLFGAAFRRLLGRPAWVRAINAGLALLLVASLYPVITELRASLGW